MQKDGKGWRKCVSLKLHREFISQQLNVQRTNFSVPTPNFSSGQSVPLATCDLTYWLPKALFMFKFHFSYLGLRLTTLNILQKISAFPQKNWEVNLRLPFSPTQNKQTNTPNHFCKMKYFMLVIPLACLDETTQRLWMGLFWLEKMLIKLLGLYWLTVSVTKLIHALLILAGCTNSHLSLLY